MKKISPTIQPDTTAKLDAIGKHMQQLLGDSNPPSYSKIIDTIANNYMEVNNVAQV